MITLQQILNTQASLLNGKKVKLVRHQEKNREKYRHVMKNREALLEHQKEQGTDLFKGCDYIVSFIGAERKHSIFLGVFKINSSKLGKNKKYYYNLTPVAEFEDLVDRVIIDWGKGRSWTQWYETNEKEVIEIRPKGFIGNFPGLLNVVLDYHDLKQMIHHPESNFEWKNHLSTVKGIYLILDNKTGQQYIGSASGSNGIWQRWTAYANDATGGNKELKTLIAKDPAYHHHFRFSILQTLPSNFQPTEAAKYEKLYKNKLGSRMHGLNWN